MTVIAFILVVVGFVLLMTVPFVIAPKMELWDLHKKFNNLELNSSWTRKTESTNPFTANKVRVIDKQMGTDGKTPWIIIEDQSGYKDYMNFKVFINLYVKA